MPTNMTNSERITEHNARLDALIELAESLPNAGSGGTAKVDGNIYTPEQYSLNWEKLQTL